MAQQTIVFVSDLSDRFQIAEDAANANFDELYATYNLIDPGSPSNGDVLTYNSSSGKYEPQAGGGGGLTHPQVLTRTLGS